MDNITSNNNANFYWWFGVVEDRDDPLRMGRCRIRILGYHNDDTEILPTSDLPWAIPIGPTTSAGTSGVGWSPTGPVNGSWVVGFFADGQDGQHPMFFGTVGSIPGGLGANGNCEPGSGPGSANDPTGSGENAADGGQPINGGPPNQEFWTLVAICACEAGAGAANAQNRADVAQTIYNRALAAKKNGFVNGGVRANILATGQYEPVWAKPRASSSSNPNKEWWNITDVNSAARATNISAKQLMDVAKKLQDASYQNNAKQFVGARTDFRGNPYKNAVVNSVDRGLGNGSNAFGYNKNGNYRGAAGVAQLPDFVKNYKIGDGSPQTTTTTTTTPKPGAK